MGITPQNKAELKQMTVCGSVGTKTNQIIKRLSRDIHSFRIPTYCRVKGDKALV